MDSISIKTLLMSKLHGFCLIPILNQGAIFVGFVIGSSDVLLLYAYACPRLAGACPHAGRVASSLPP